MTNRTIPMILVLLICTYFAAAIFSNNTSGTPINVVKFLLYVDFLQKYLFYRRT